MIFDAKKVLKSKIINEENLFPQRLVPNEEVDLVLVQCSINKVPGSDGLNAVIPNFLVIYSG